MIVNRTPPSMVAKNLSSTCHLICSQVQIVKLPNINYIRKMYGFIWIIGEILAAYELAKNKHWVQLFWDESARYTISLTVFAAGIKDKDTVELWAILLSCSEVDLDSISEDTCGVKRIIEKGGEYLTRWASTCELKFLSYIHDIPSSEDLLLTNAIEAAPTIDTYN